MALRGISFICIRLMMILTVNFPFFWLTQSTRGNVAAGHCKKMKVRVSLNLSDRLLLCMAFAHTIFIGIGIFSVTSLFSLSKLKPDWDKLMEGKVHRIEPFGPFIFILLYYSAWRWRQYLK